MVHLLHNIMRATSAARSYQNGFDLLCRPKMNIGRCIQHLLCRKYRVYKSLERRSQTKYPLRYRNCSSDQSKSHQRDVPSYADTDSLDCINLIKSQDMVVIRDFLSEAEELSILDEISPYMARLRYEYSHWDDVSLITIFVGLCPLYLVHFNYVLSYL